MKIFGIIIIIGLIGFFLWSPSDIKTNTAETNTTVEEGASSETAQDNRNVFSSGTYIVQAEESIVNWAGKKPLVEGYINSGLIAVTDGTIVAGENSATGIFTIDMNTLSASDTPTKPGSENALEGHLKGERWFDVEAFPEASFSITEVKSRADSETTFEYDITGKLTMKDVTGTLSFPATIYTDDNGTLHAKADFEFDRTVWGITAGSGSFFDSLADNVIDDMVALSFKLVAEKQ